MSFVTCDLCDDNADLVSVVTGLNWFSYGGRSAFGGEIVTVKCFEDNSRVKEHLGTDGKGKVLVVDGGPREMQQRSKRRRSRMSFSSAAISAGPAA